MHAFALPRSPPHRATLPQHNGFAHVCHRFVLRPLQHPPFSAVSSGDGLRPASLSPALPACTPLIIFAPCSAICVPRLPALTLPSCRPCAALALLDALSLVVLTRPRPLARPPSHTVTCRRASQQCHRMPNEGCHHTPCAAIARPMPPSRSLTPPSLAFACCHPLARPPFVPFIPGSCTSSQVTMPHQRVLGHLAPHPHTLAIAHPPSCAASRACPSRGPSTSARSHPGLPSLMFFSPAPPLMPTTTLASPMTALACPGSPLLAFSSPVYTLEPHPRALAPPSCPRAPHSLYTRLRPPSFVAPSPAHPLMLRAPPLVPTAALARPSELHCTDAFARLSGPSHTPPMPSGAAASPSPAVVSQRLRAPLHAHTQPPRSVVVLPVDLAHH
ncbi:hypothetical protein DENSPDRAFT_885048 [Dentipellis sp. KUC8613]|nr:hypothetical protein DENSPDRAFT_885048 [Dentipellis sp. KUC8613]